MPDAVTETPVVVTTVERNNVSANVIKNKIRRGENKGTEYLDIDTESLSLEQLCNWIGADDAKKRLSAFVSQKSQGWFSESLNDDGTWNEEKSLTYYVEFAKSFSARGEKIADLKEEREELFEKLVLLVAKGLQNPEVQKDADKIGQQIASINAAIKQKKRKTKEDIEAEKTEPAA